MWTWPALNTKCRILWPRRKTRYFFFYVTCLLQRLSRKILENKVRISVLILLYFILLILFLSCRCDMFVIVFSEEKL